jgi:hypothetical protein
MWGASDEILKSCGSRKLKGSCRSRDNIAEHLKRAFTARNFVRSNSADLSFVPYRGPVVRPLLPLSPGPSYRYRGAKGIFRSAHKEAVVRTVHCKPRLGGRLISSFIDAAQRRECR